MTFSINEADNASIHHHVCADEKAVIAMLVLCVYSILQTHAKPASLDSNKIELPVAKTANILKMKRVDGEITTAAQKMRGK